MRNKTKMISGNAGFTLVELIVVIAIIAILSGIGTVGYSAYVDRANRAADEQMISDIEQALILGAYSKNYAPGSTVGAVGVNKGSNATDSADDWDKDGVNDVDEMMNKAFGANWREELQLKSDWFGNSDSSKIWDAIQNSKKDDGTSIFDSVPNSSFYAQAGNTDALVADVDDIASALDGVLNGVGYAFSKFWGDDFHNSVKEGGLVGNEWQNDPQMAANLTVFAAANQITGSSEDQLNAWINSWTGSTEAVSAGKDGYVADLVMQYAQCVAVYNYAKNQGGKAADGIESTYQTLENAMAALKNPSASGGYVGDFNAAINSYWNSVGNLRQDWQNSGQAAEDANALLASMTALNTLEDKYVNKDQVGLLTQENAFTNVGAANILDTMVTYASMANPPSGDYVITLSIDRNGTPVISPTLVEE